LNDLRPVWLVATREAYQRLTSRAFLIFTFIVIFVVVVGILLVSELPSIINTTDRLGVVGGEPGVGAALSASAKGHNASVQVVFFRSPNAGQAALQDGRIDALLLDQKRLVFESEPDDKLTLIVDAALTELTLPARARALGLVPEEARALISPPGVDVSLLNPKPVSSGGTNRWAAASVAVIALYVSLAMYGNWVLMGVVEEKTSRVVEVLLGVLQPEQLLTGKVLGIVFTAMVQLGAGILAGLATLALVGSAHVPAVALGVTLVSVAFFVIGIVFYNFIYAAVGATVARQSEAASASMPVALMLLAPYLIALTYVPSHPHEGFVRALSLLPLSAPLVMPARVAAGASSPVEIAISLLLMLPALALMIWLAGRIYVGAILRSGPRITLFEAFRSAGTKTDRIKSS
jgi:ABC-2 type transport system permease protein